MKTYEKIITILITLTLFVCLYLTGLSVIRTAARYVPKFMKNISHQFAGTYDSFPANGFRRDNLTWEFTDGILIIDEKGKRVDHTEKLPDMHAASGNIHFISCSGVLFRGNTPAPTIIPSETLQKFPGPFPAVSRQITSYILYILLYFQNNC